MTDPLLILCWSSDDLHGWWTDKNNLEDQCVGIGCMEHLLHTLKPLLEKNIPFFITSSPLDRVFLLAIFQLHVEDFDRFKYSC